jgi:enoyl-CoA hydratase
MNGIEGLVIRRERNLGRVTLDRPKALNALTLDMVRGLTTALVDWADDPRISVIVLDGAGDRAFCAGGDIRSIFDADRANGNTYARSFWREEYMLNHLISTYRKPIVALMSGIVMGGGAGLSVHARFRMVDETSRFAMPETGIGLFPDVGGSRFLSRMPGETGTYLALTGKIIDATDMLFGGLADVLVLRRDRAQLLDMLDEIDSAGPEAFTRVDTGLRELASPPGPASLSDRATIDRVFTGNEVEAILARLDAEGSEWSSRTAELMRTKSPTSMKITLAALRRGRALPDLKATLAMEYRIACRVAAGRDFYEGVRATLIDKDRNPKWQPARLEDVSDADVAAFFAPLGVDELTL